MRAFTFDYTSQWMNGFYQVTASDEKQARELLKAYATTERMTLISILELKDDLVAPCVLYAREIDNPDYEG